MTNDFKLFQMEAGPVFWIETATSLQPSEQLLPVEHLDVGHGSDKRPLLHYSNIDLSWSHNDPGVRCRPSVNSIWSCCERNIAL